MKTRAGPLRLLFVCSRNRRRSPTAERVFEGREDCEVASAGLAPDADEGLTPELVKWADIIFVMEQIHRTRLKKRFGLYLNRARVVVLQIADNYDFMDDRLVSLLEMRVKPWLHGQAGRRDTTRLSRRSP